MSGIPSEVRERLQQLKAEFEARGIKSAPSRWWRLSVGTRTVLLLMAGIDSAEGADLSALAHRDWREFSPPEQEAITCAARAMRSDLNSVGDLQYT